MINKSIKKIWLVCLCFASIALAGCFHIPNEDWLPSKNKVDTWNTEQNDEMQQAVDSFAEGIDMISTQRNEMKNDKNVEINTESIVESGENNDNEDIIIGNESENQKIEETSEE